MSTKKRKLANHAAAVDEFNNNNSDVLIGRKRRRTMEQRLQAQLQSDFTDKGGPVSPSNSTHIEQMDSTDNSVTQCDGTDFEDSIKAHRLKKAYEPAQVEINDIELVNLVSSPEGSEGADTSNDTYFLSEGYSLNLTPMVETDAIILMDVTQDNKTDSSTEFKSNDLIGKSNSPFNSDASSSKEDTDEFTPTLEYNSEDCVIIEAGEKQNFDSSDQWRCGQIVWASLHRYPFWPAIITNDDEEQCFKKDNRIHVKFLYDNGRYNWVSEKSAILPFKGREEYNERCKLPANKNNKAYNRNMGSQFRRWNLAIHEAKVLQNIKASNRIDFYDKILMKCIQEIDKDMRNNRRSSRDRCGTPQTFDTAYSSMKQSVSPASLSPTLNELDQNYDETVVDKKVDNYLKSFEQNQEDLDEALPEEEDEMAFAPLVELAASTGDQFYCRLVEMVYDQLRDGSLLHANVIANENLFLSNLRQLNLDLTSDQLNTSSASIKRRRSSLATTASNSTAEKSEHRTRTKRQRSLAEFKDKIIRKQMERVELQAIDLEYQKQAKEQNKKELKPNTEGQILSFCMKNHPANILLKGISKEPVCQRCLEPGLLMKCAGKCYAHFHKECFKQPIVETEYNAILQRKMLADEDETVQITTIQKNGKQLQCTFCSTSQPNACFVCAKSDADCVSCCEKNCGKAYHIDCLKFWPQHKKLLNNKIVSLKSCPRHVCHTCVSPDIRLHFNNTEPERKLIKCLQCPGTYHRSSECIPAGSELLSESQLICARHQPKKKLNRLNINYCLFCSKGGSLICCDACVYSFHEECLKVPVGDHFICEECESGRRPLYGEIVWSKYGCSSWWPAIIVPTPCIPYRVLGNKKEPNQICVFFFGTHNYGWVSQTHIYLYLKGDSECKNKNEKQKLSNAIDEAEQWMERFNAIIEKKNSNAPKSTTKSNKPPPYRKIKTNRILAKFKDSDYSECNCRPDDLAPCSIESDCYNAVLNIECDPMLCPAKDKCQNQNFHRGEQFKFNVQRTSAKGWGLFAAEEIPIDKFVIEYVGEVVDQAEFSDRFNRSTANKEDNFYFLQLGNALYIDSAFYGNEGRFINHSCDPNVAPKKWTVYSNEQAYTRIGFFALRKIEPGEEITFDYNWDNNNKTECQCGSKKCRGFI